MHSSISSIYLLLVLSMVSLVLMKKNTINFRGYKQSELEKFFKEVLGYNTEPSKILAHMIIKSDKKIYTEDDFERELTKAYMMRDISKET